MTCFLSRVSASADATMATWGGSTVDNLESITEDDDGQQGANMEEEEDDGEKNVPQGLAVPHVSSRDSGLNLRGCCAGLVCYL